MTYFFLICVAVLVVLFPKTRAKAVCKEIDSKKLIEALRILEAKKKRPSTFP